MNKDEIEQKMKNLDGEELAKKRADYYAKWRHLSKEQIEQAIAEEEEAERLAKEKLGLDKDEPKSEAERREREKREAVKAAKKLWDDRKATETEQKFVVENEEGVTKSLGKGDLQHRPVLVVRGAKRCNYTLEESLNGLVKIFVDDCEDTVLTIKCALITQHCEVSHCERFTLVVARPINTIQLDLCDGVTVDYHQNCMQQGNRVYHAGVKNLRVRHWTHDAKEHDYTKLEEEELAKARKGLDPNTPLEELQFVTHLVPDRDVLKTERVTRSHGIMPLTDEELARTAGSVEIEKVNVRRAEEKKVGGNEAFKSGEYYQAGVFYTEAISLAPSDKTLLATCLANRAACYLKLGRPEDALDDANACVEVDPKYVKGWFRKGIALHAMKQFGPAIEALSKADALEPKNKQITEAVGFAKVMLAKEIREREERLKYS